MKETLNLKVNRYTCVKCGTKFLDIISIEGEVKKPKACANRRCRKVKYDGSKMDCRARSIETWGTRRRRTLKKIPEALVCRICDRVYKDKDQLDAHNNRRHKSKSDIPQ